MIAGRLYKTVYDTSLVKSAKFAYSQELVRLSGCLYVCFNHELRSHLSENKNVQIAFVDFDICHRMVQLQKLHSVTLTYFWR